MVDVVRAWLAEPGVEPSRGGGARPGGLASAGAARGAGGGGRPGVVDPARRHPRPHRPAGRAGLPAHRRRARRHPTRRPGRGPPPPQPGPARWIDKWLAAAGRSTTSCRRRSASTTSRCPTSSPTWRSTCAAVAAVGRDGTSRAVLEYVRDEVGLGQAVDLLDASGGGEGQSHRDDLDALLQVADLHPDPAGFSHGCGPPWPGPPTRRGSRCPPSTGSRAASGRGWRCSARATG